MSIWTPPTVAQAPGLVLSGWRAYKVLIPANQGLVTAHLVGYNETDGEGRVSSSLVRFDLESRCGATASGRVYRLTNHEGLGADAEYVWAKWLRIYDAEVLESLSLAALSDFISAAAGE